jgi:hypothetical protein
MNEECSANGRKITHAQCCSENLKILARPRHKCAGNRSRVKEIRREVVGWIQLAENRDHMRDIVKAIMNLRLL